MSNTHGCCDSSPCDCKDRKRKRNHKGSGLLKFTGLVATAFEAGTPITSHLADPGLGLSADPNNTGYPFAVKRRARNLAVNIPNYTVFPGGSIVIELRRNGIVIPDFTITYTGGETGVKVIHAEKKFHEGDLLDLQVTTAGLTDIGGAGVNVAATIGLKP